jgi:hypothetical protein
MVSDENLTGIALTCCNRRASDRVLPAPPCDVDDLRASRAVSGVQFDQIDLGRDDALRACKDKMERVGQDPI